MLREWLRRFWGTLTRSRRDRDMEAELRSHLELASEDRGRSQTGNVNQSLDQAMEAMRDQRGLPWLDALMRDARFALRSLRRTPVFTAVALLTLALGIGANTAIFSIVNGAILHPLKYPKPEQLMYLNTQTPATALLEDPVSLPEYFEFRELNRSFADVGAYITGEVNLIGGDKPLRVPAATVDGQLLSALGIQPADGRLFAKGETDVTGKWHPGDPANMPPPAIAILSHELWQNSFGGQPMVGKTIEVDGKRSKVVGIMPPGTDLMDNHTQIWLPLGLNPAMRQYRGWHVLSLVGRLKDGVSVQAAQAELDTLMATWGDRVGLKPENGIFMPLGSPRAHILQMRPMQDVILGSASRAIWVLQAAVGLVLLIACANLANLLLARAETRHREFAVRAALGASRGRLLQQFMTEAVVLSVSGGLLGLSLAWIGVQALIRAYPTNLPRMSEVNIDLPVLLFTIGVSLATGLIFGLAPIAHTRVKALAAVVAEGGTRTTGGRTRHRIRGGLVIAEIALAVTLVIGAALLVRTVYNLTNVDAGFDRSRLVTFSITTPANTYPQTTRGQMYQRLLAALRSVPGVQSATATSALPPDRPRDGDGTFIDNYIAPDGEPGANVDHYQSVLSNYFETMGIPIVQGRSFQPADGTSSGMVAIVNETFAKKFWKGLNPIGQHLRPSWAKPWFTVIGVAKDVKQAGLDQTTGTEFYFFVDQMAYAPNPLGRAPGTLHVVLRTTLPPSALSRTVDNVVRDLDQSVPVVQFRELEAVFEDSIQRPRLLANLVGVFAGLALMLAAIGAYGVLSYMVTERQREFGIRLALGAAPSGVVAMVIKQGFKLTAAGILIGLAAAFFINKLISSLLFGVEPTDGLTFGTAIATIGIAAALACALPAWRAARLAPNVMLRHE